MDDVEDKDLGFQAILKELKALDGAVVTTGVQSTADAEMVKNATRHEYGSKEWTITSKQAFFIAKVLMRIEDPSHRFLVWRKLVGKKMKIPERSFLRSTFDREQATFAEAMTRVQEAVLSGKMTASVALRQFGLFSETMFQNGFDKVKPPLSGLTIALRPKGDGSGNHKPLVLSGRLRSSIKSVVRMGDGQ